MLQPKCQDYIISIEKTGIRLDCVVVITVVIGSLHSWHSTARVGVSSLYSVGVYSTVVYTQSCEIRVSFPRPVGKEEKQRDGYFSLKKIKNNSRST